MSVINSPEYKATAHAFNLNGPLLIVNEKTQHAMAMPIDNTRQMNDSPRVHPRNHTGQALKTLTK